MVQAQLLRQGAWEGQKIDQVLLRLPGTKRTARRLGGAIQRGVVIPASQVVAQQISPEEAAGF
jgi:hypothetical protein